MSAGETMAGVLEPEARWLEIPCVCGQTVRVPSALTGRTGTCPHCRRPFVTPGVSPGALRAGGVFETVHPEREFKRLAFEPTFADRDSAYAVAQRHSVIPGVMYILAILGVAEIMIGQPAAFEAAIGLPASPRWLAPAWLMAFCLVATTFVAASAAAFRLVTGRAVTADRIAFASAGGYDVARWIPLLGYFALFLLCAVTRGAEDRLPAIRDPWTFLATGAGLGYVATWLAAWWVFRCRFGRSFATSLRRGHHASVAR
jgi:hypothetical protein